MKTFLALLALVASLDPAGRGWHRSSNRLAASNGQYVEAIHTDGNFLGILNPSGNADFYPNGGTHPQPGCGVLNSCSHSHAPDLFASTVRYNHLVGKLCPNIWEAQLSTCNGAAFNIGNGIISKRGNGLYALRTGLHWLGCANYYR